MIDPALAPADWQGHSHVYPQKHHGDITLDATGGEVVIDQLRGGNRATLEAVHESVQLPHRVFPSVIAIVNDTYPDGDPRKITQEHVNALMHLVWQTDQVRDDAKDPEDAPAQELASRLAEILESYLRPKDAPKPY